VIQAMLGAPAAPGLLDRSLARTAYEAQMSSEPAGDGSSILRAPADRDHGTHGRFDADAKPRVVSASAALVRGATALLAAGVLAGLFAIGRRTRGELPGRRA
jgi:hypothetical protein